jgi:hypothetical protein
MPALTHVSGSTTIPPEGIPPEGNPSTASIALYSVVDFGTDVPYLAQETDTETDAHISRDRFNLVQKNAKVHFGNLPVGDTWALVWSEIRSDSSSGVALPITEISIIASYSPEVGAANIDTRSYVRVDAGGNLMPVFYSLPTPGELCGMIEDKSGTLGTLDSIVVLVFFGGATEANNLLLSALHAACGTCNGKPLFIAAYVPRSSGGGSMTSCPGDADFVAASAIQNIVKNTSGLCQWVREMITAKYYVPALWGIPFQASFADLIIAIGNVT